MTDRSTAAVNKKDSPRGLVSQKRIPVGSDTYNRLLETLYDEAAALDERRFADWMAMLGEDLIYTAPIRITRTGANKNHDIMYSMMHFDDNYASIKVRVDRLGMSAWAEDPPSRTRRLVTNARMGHHTERGQFEVVSYLYIERSRADNYRNEKITAERRDIWRETGDGYKLSRREILVDQSVLGMSNFAIFL